MSIIKLNYVILFVITFVNVKSDLITQGFIKDFLDDKNLPLVTVFGCWENYERTDFCRSLMRSERKVSYIPIPQEGLSMRSILTVNYYKLGVFLDLDCPQSENVLEQFSREGLPFNESYYWMLMSQTADEPPASLLRKLPLTIATELTIAIRNKTKYTLYDVYNPSYRHGGKLNVTYMGNWEPDRGLMINLTQYKYQRRGDLHGLTLNSSIAITFPPVPDFMTYISNPIDRHLDTMHRFHYALIKQLRDYYNFTINLMRTNSWGFLVNGTWDGMVGEMVAGRVDIGSTPLRFKPERMEAVEYTVKTWVARVVFIFRHPKKNEVRNGFVRPFTDEIWWITVVFGVFGWLFLWFTVRLGMYFNKHPPVSTLETLPASETAMITIAALCQQGLTDGPVLYSGRIVFIFVFFWGLLLYQFYSASVVGSLLAEPPRHIKTIRDLVDSNLLVGVENISYLHDYFRTTTKPLDLELYTTKIAKGKKRKHDAYYSVEEGLRKVQEGGFAFFIEIATAYKIITDTFSEDEICDLEEIPLFPPQVTYTVTSKHSPFKKMVTYGMRHIIECGVAERLRHIWSHKRPRCPASHSSKPSPVSIGEFSPALFLLLVGIGFATSVVLAEKCYILYTSSKSFTNEQQSGTGTSPQRIFKQSELLPSSCLE